MTVNFHANLSDTFGRRPFLVLSALGLGAGLNHAEPERAEGQEGPAAEFVAQGGMEIDRHQSERRVRGREESVQGRRRRCDLHGKEKAKRRRRRGERATYCRRIFRA